MVAVVAPLGVVKIDLLGIVQVEVALGVDSCVNLGGQMDRRTASSLDDVSTRPRRAYRAATYLKVLPDAVDVDLVRKGEIIARGIISNESGRE